MEVSLLHDPYLGTPPAEESYAPLLYGIVT